MRPLENRTRICIDDLRGAGIAALLEEHAAEMPGRVHDTRAVGAAARCRKRLQILQ